MDVSLVPQRVGPERVVLTGPHAGYDEAGSEFVAFAGTGFDPDSDQHRFKSDGLRYAIAIQQARDAKNYNVADNLRQRAGCAFRVECGKDCTRLIYVPKPAFY